MASVSSDRADRPRPDPAPLRAVRLLGWLPYREGWEIQKRIHADRVLGACPDTLLLLEHEPVVTIGRNGRSANLCTSEELLRARGIDLVWTDRGGDVTYHGPGQLVGYPIVDLKELHQDVHRFLREIEEGIIRTLSRFGIAGSRIEGRTGVWVDGAKIASIGLKASHWVTMHGFALNVSTDLSPFDLIVPCGLSECRMTSMELLLGREVGIDAAASLLVDELSSVWGRLPMTEELRSWPS